LFFVERLGGVVRQVVDKCSVDVIVVFGGDTLRAVMNALDVFGLKPVDEVVSGVPVSIPFGGKDFKKQPNLIIISKAGGFGDADIISRILRYIEGLRLNK
jgi:uncharacterized protein YgbK (DUF1537 family)